jgi:hypothetical protein
MTGTAIVRTASPWRRRIMTSNKEPPVIGGTKRFGKARRREENALPRIQIRPYSPETVELAMRAAETVERLGAVKKGDLTVLMGCGAGGMVNALMYITQCYPRIAESDDGCLVWTDE